MIYKRRDYAWLGGVVNQMTKNFLQSKRRRRVKIFHSLQEGWIGNWYLMNYWFAWRGGDIVFEIWIHLQNQLFAYGGDFPRGSLQISARWNPLFLLIFLKFCHIYCVEIGSNIVFCHSELWPFLNVELGFAECTTSVTWCYKNRCTIRFSTKFFVKIKVCSHSTAIRGHKFPSTSGITCNLRA